MGFLFNKGGKNYNYLFALAYLWDYWNIFDFIILGCMGLSIFANDLGIHSVNSIRAFRVLRPLRTISSIGSLKIMVSSILKSL